MGDLHSGPVVLMRLSSKFLLAGVATLILGLGGRASAAEARYNCAGKKVVARFSPPDLKTGFVKLTFADGRKVTLPQAMSADGGRYADADLEFWIKGRDATLTRGGKATHCSGR